MAGTDARGSNLASPVTAGEWGSRRETDAPRAAGLPTPCGPLSEGVVRALTAAPEEHPRPAPEREEAATVTDPLGDRDFQLALWMLYELHYRGFPGVSPDLEWDPLLLAARAPLERAFEAAVRELSGPLPWPPEEGRGSGRPAEAVADLLFEMTGSGPLPELAGFLQRDADEEQFRAYLAQRAVYHLRESDPQSFLLPRLDGAPKVALAELQYDEYGGGLPERLHAALYADALTSLDMPTDVVSYVDTADAETLASVNLMSLFALNRRLRGAALGHLAAFEATSSVPCRMIALGARRLGLPAAVAEYYDEHVEADSVHEQLAIRSICGALVDQDPDLAEDVVLGAAACLAVDALAGEVLLSRWRDVPAEAAG
ncbi:MAG TPA: iron-containing redox enzyme family protein [Nocardioides sp.]|nr:iron-containing redox enzyme family protein [Nocardioides sp.]